MHTHTHTDNKYLNWKKAYISGDCYFSVLDYSQLKEKTKSAVDQVEKKKHAAQITCARNSNVGHIYFFIIISIVDFFILQH